MNTQELIKIEDDYFINTFTRQPIVLDHGEGVKVTDIDGNEYLDMFAGIAVNALGHNHPKLVKAILPKGFINVPYNDIEAIKEAITENTAAIIVEPIQGEGGINIPDMEYLKEIEKICNEKDIVFIVDEVQTGFGRCGTLFAHELFDVKPDIMTMAKGIGGGVPMGGILATEKVASAFVPGDHGTTFGGGPLVCAAANAVLDTIIDENILDNVNEVGEYFISELKKLDKDVIADVRGKGLMVGVELTKPGAEYVDKLREAVTKEEIDEFVKALDEIL